MEKARALRRELTSPEILLWQPLHGDRLSGSRFHRQHPIGRLVLDFRCSDAKLAVEVDGSAHDHPDRVLRDAERDVWLTARGICVLRLSARDLMTGDGRESVLAAPSTALGAVFLPRFSGEE